VLTIALALALAATRTSAEAAASQPESARRAADEMPTPSEIEDALETVRADPNLTPERTIKTLRWKQATETKPFREPSWLKWIADFFGWIGQSARRLMWVAIGLLAAWLAVYIVRMTRSRSMPLFEEPFVAPTHVRNLDIRPESLPPDVGRAARALWDGGDRRAALALLYRGLLSRLTHVHRVPIRDSSTEGDCLALAARHLGERRHDYTARLVRAWQRFVYGGEDVPADTVHVLCDDFAPMLDRGAALDSAKGGAA
jgi:hypothetical protein